MKIIENLKVGQRLAVGFGIVLVLMLALTGVAISRMSFIRMSLDQIVEDDAVKLRLVNSMRDSVRYQSVTVRDVVMQEDFAFKKKELTLAKQSKDAYLAAAEQLGKLLKDQEGKVAMAKAAETEVKVRSAVDKAIDLSLSGDQGGAANLIRDEVRPLQMELIGMLDTLLQQVENGSKNSALEAGQIYRNAVLLMTIFGALALAVGVAAAWLITRGLLKQLGGEPAYAVEIAGKIAAGDLAVEINTKRDDYSSLLFAMMEMRNALARIVGEVHKSTDTITTASSEIASGNLDLSSRTEQQASSLEETSSSMETLTSIVKQNADNARQADGLANSATEVARKGGAVVAQVVDTMKEINESARKIVDIIGVIDGIAFQTNILALNAAVEAARAGEQGRGFAVVASEVRNLAQRSAAAAKEIKSLIGTSVERVDTGAKLVDQAGATMEEIVESVKRVTDIISEIAAASREQAAGIEKVNQAINQMDEVTQQNASLVEQAAAAAESLKEQTTNLSQVVSVFKLSDTQNPLTWQEPKLLEEAPATYANATKPPIKKASEKTAPDPELAASRKITSGGKERHAVGDDWEEF